MGAAPGLGQLGWQPQAINHAGLQGKQGGLNRCAICGCALDHFVHLRCARGDVHTAEVAPLLDFKRGRDHAQHGVVLGAAHRARHGQLAGGAVAGLGRQLLFDLELLLEALYRAAQPGCVVRHRLHHRASEPIGQALHAGRVAAGHIGQQPKIQRVDFGAAVGQGRAAQQADRLAPAPVRHHPVLLRDEVAQGAQRGQCVCAQQHCVAPRHDGLACGSADGHWRARRFGQIQLGQRKQVAKARRADGGHRHAQ